jgi:tetratricopeptide (TPR) repeat protein
MLIDEGVIVIDGETWQVLPESLASVHIPPTLTALLQARLDGLPPAERLVLQRAAVIGRTFWDGLVQALTSEDQEASQVNARLAGLRARGLVFKQERSSISGHQEYLFKHALLRDAAYETVLLKQRRIYHSQVGAWIEKNAGERLEEHLALIAGHYAEGGQPDLAADWFTRAAERAFGHGLMQDARNLFDQALKHIQPDDLPRRWRALQGHDQVVGTLGYLSERHADDAALLSMAQQMKDDSWLAIAYWCCGSQAMTEGDLQAAEHAFEQGLHAARRASDIKMQALILPLQVFTLTTEGKLPAAAGLVEEALASASQTGDPDILARALTNVAVYYQATGDVARGVQLLQQQVEITRQRGNLQGEAIGLLNLGYQYLSLGQFTNGRSLLEGALQAAAQLGARRYVAYSLLNLGLAEWRLDQSEAAIQTLQRCRVELEALGDQVGMAWREFYLGLADETNGQLNEATSQFQVALDAFDRLGASPHVVEAQAGLARLALQRGQLPEAGQFALQISAYLEGLGPQGLELPILAYLTCARVFQALGDTPRLEQILHSGRDELQSRLDRIREESWRKTFLEALPEHRQLMDFS